MSDKENTNWFDKLTEIFGWFQIMLTPTLIGIVLGGLFYLYSPNNIGKIVGITISLVGLIIGINWASRIKKKYGTIWFVSRIMATPELDSKKKPADIDKKEKNANANKG